MPREAADDRTPRERPLRKMRVVLLLLILPMALLGPPMAKGEEFLPWMPVGLEPLATENPEAAAAAFRKANFPQGDRVFPVVTDQIAISEELARGRLPVWEPLLALGVPLYAGSIAGAAYPPNWLAFFVPPETAAAPLAMLSLFLAGLGMWLFLTRLGFTRHAALAGVIAFQLGGWGITNLYYYMKVDAALWLPWSLWAIEGLRTKKPWSGVALTLSIAFSLLAGFVTVALFALAFATLYAIARWFAPLQSSPNEPAAGDVVETRRPRVSGLLVVGLFCALGILGSGVQLFPSFEASRESLRVDRSVEDLAAESLPAATWLGTFLPDLFGGPTETTAPGNLPVAWWLTPSSQVEKAEVANQLEWGSWAGFLVVLLAFTGVVSSPRRAAFPLIGLLLVFAFAQGMRPLTWLYHLPGLNIGSPARALAVAWVLWPWLVAIGIERLHAGAPRAERTLLLSSFVCAVVFFLLWTAFEPTGFAKNFEDTMLARYGDDPLITREAIRAKIPPAEVVLAGERLVKSYAHAFGASLAGLAAGLFQVLAARRRPRFGGSLRRAPVILGVTIVCLLLIAPMGPWSFPAGKRSPATSTALIAAALVCGAAWTRRKRSEAGSLLPLLAALALEGLLAANGHVVGRDDDELPLFPPSHAIEGVRTAAGDGRVLRYDPTPSGVGHVEDMARPNMLEPYGIADITAYTVFTPRTLNQLCAAVDPNMRFRTGIASLRELSLVEHRVFDLLRIRAIISYDTLSHPRLEPFFERPGFNVYRRSGALPGARVVPRLEVVSDEDTALAAVVEGHVAFDDAAVVTAADAAAFGIAEGGATPADFQPGHVSPLSRPSRDRVHIDVQGTSGGWLVLHEQSYPGWHATVNGEPAEILRVDYTYRAVKIPAGDVHVEVWYAPTSVYFGILLSVLSPLLALFLSKRLAR